MFFYINFQIIQNQLLYKRLKRKNAFRREYLGSKIDAQEHKLP